MEEDKENFDFFVGNEVEELDPIPFDIKEETDELENRPQFNSSNLNSQNKETELDIFKSFLLY